MYARTTGAEIQRNVPATSPFQRIGPWIGVTVCAAMTLVLGFYPIAPSDIVPFVTCGDGSCPPCPNPAAALATTAAPESSSYTDANNATLCTRKQ
jgi:hypothetical protein